MSWINLAGIFGGCVALAFIATSAMAAQTNTPEVTDITIERTGETLWRVEYRLTTAVQALNFGPAVAQYRETSWHLPAEFELILDEHDEESVRRVDQEAFDNLTFEIHAYDHVVPKNYVPFNTFSDGGVSFYSGFFVPSLISDGQAAQTQARFSVYPREGEKVILAGQVTQQVTAWMAPLQEHAFVYVGTAVPVESENLVAVFDPALPAWLKQHFETKLPEVFAYLSTRFHRQLDTRPAVFVSAIFDPESQGYSYNGGTQPHQIQFRLRGQTIDEPNDNLQHFFDKFFAHEGAHLWQNLNRSQGESAWIHEGGAEAIALATVRDLAMWDDEAQAGALASAKEECASGLSTTSLEDAAAAGAFNLYYSCGLLIARATEASLQAADPNTDIIDFHRQYMAEIEDTDGLYTLASYLAVFEALGGNPKVSASIENLVSSRLDHPATAIEALLSDAMSP